MRIRFINGGVPYFSVCMKFNLLLSFLIGTILFTPAVLAYQSDGPTGLTAFVFGIFSSVSDFLNKIFAAPNLVVSDAKFSGDDLQVTITNNGKATATFSSDIVEAGIIPPIKKIDITPLCTSAGNFCVDNPQIAKGFRCTERGGKCLVRGAQIGRGQCSCIFRRVGTSSESIKLDAGKSTTITIQNVGAPTASTEYSFTINRYGNIKEFSSTKTISP